ncbi:hypothetical protein [Streptomyces sp. NPDC058466]|uniref:hypothetical protein n=1 Tax=Streptomyces sp. NPDC058466 TaxID=3346512 RepID=UPI00364F31C5
MAAGPPPDSTGTLNATLSGGYSWTTDTTRGNALNLSGTTGYADTTGPAVDTSKSFTVSALVKLNSLTANSTFRSQNGTTNDGFQLLLWRPGLGLRPAQHRCQRRSLAGRLRQQGRHRQVDPPGRHLRRLHEGDTPLSRHKLSATRD